MWRGGQAPESQKAQSGGVAVLLVVSPQSLRMIREHGLSVAIFAPGWVYEHLGPGDFLNNEDK